MLFKKRKIRLLSSKRTWSNKHRKRLKSWTGTD